MAKTDVVKHDLNPSEATIDWNADVPPIPLRSPPDEKIPLPEVAPPIDRKITGEDLNQFPYRSIGKMQMQFDPLRSFYGSGWVVAPRAFITAGHCIYDNDNGGWVEKAAFCPRYDASCPKAWVVSTVYTLQGWYADTDWAYDLAACVVTEPFTAEEPPIPFSIFLVPELKYVSIGYPRIPTDKHDFNGKRMWRSQGNLVSYDPVGILTAACDLTSGASGGPWMEPPDGATAGGITSRRADVTGYGDSPIFGQGFQNLYDAVKDL